MRAPQHTSSLVSQVLTSGRLVLMTMFVCCLVYGAAILAFGQVVAPERAEGSLVRDAHGTVIGSTLIAQRFTRPGYFRSRPSAVDYNAAAAGGSNLSPTHPELRMRADSILALTATAAASPVPADLIAASGSGLDPHITLTAARYQAKNVAAARNLPVATVTDMLSRCTTRPPLASEPLVNVLLVNMALDRAKQ